MRRCLSSRPIICYMKITAIMMMTTTTTMMMIIVCQGHEISPAPHCRVLPPGEFTGVIAELSDVDTERFTTVDVTVYMQCCWVTNRQHCYSLTDGGKHTWPAVRRWRDVISRQTDDDCVEHGTMDSQPRLRDQLTASTIASQASRCCMLQIANRGPAHPLFHCHVPIASHSLSLSCSSRATVPSERSHVCRPHCVDTVWCVGADKTATR